MRKVDQRYERKDAHDLVYCIENLEDGLDAIADGFRAALSGKHGEAVELAVGILEKRFADDDATQGFEKDGPVAVSKFELGDDAAQREARILRQREVSDLVMALLERIRA